VVSAGKPDTPSGWPLIPPQRGWWLQDAELIAIRVGQNVPAPSGLGDRLLRQYPGAQAHQPLRLGLQVASAQVEVDPVLALLALGCTVGTNNHWRRAMDRHVAIYCRLSPRPDGRSEGVDVQERQGREYAAAAWPAVPVVVYSDRLLSAADEDVWRPGFEKLRQAIRDGEVARVWCVEQSRLQRLEVGWFVLAAELVAAGIDEIHTNRDGIVRVADDIAGIKAVLAAGEVRKLKKRVNDRLADNAAQGQPAGSVPFGFRHGTRDDGTKTYHQVPGEAEAIRWAMERFLAGWALQGITADLRKRGLTGAHGGTLTAGSVRSWLTNPTVAGWRVHRGVITGRGNWDPILTEDEWQACRARLAAPRAVRTAEGGSYPVSERHKGFTGRKYVLTGGLAVCGVCGAAMLGSVKQLKGGARRGGRDVAYYLCHPSRGGRACTGIMLEPTEKHVIDRLFAELDKPGFLDAIAEDAHAARRDEITTALAAADGKRRELARMWGTPGGLTSEEWAEARAALDASERELRAELDEKGPPPARVDIEQARASWPDMTLGEQREFLRLFISRVTISRATPGLQRFDPDRIAIEWRKR
jgi:site-specific DNA recombinase